MNRKAEDKGKKAQNKLVNKIKLINRLIDIWWALNKTKKQNQREEKFKIMIKTKKD
jgi:hypothetical protein